MEVGKNNQSLLMMNRGREKRKKKLTFSQIGSDTT
jgi:hypothetical protein